MITPASLQVLSVATEIHVLQQAAYAVEAQLIGHDDFPPLHETREALQNSTDYFLVYKQGGSIIACLSWEQTGIFVTVTRLVVSPPYFRQGIASALLQALENRVPAGNIIYASTAELNVPAIKAYEKQGYITAGRQLAPEGIMLRRLQKKIERAGAPKS